LFRFNVSLTDVNSDTPLRKKQARSLTPGKRTDDKENSSPNVQKINKERTDKKPKKAEDEVQNHYLLIQKFILEQNEFVLVRGNPDSTLASLSDPFVATKI
jgi:hypothetical protein